jgi:hypothetical protein
MRRAVAGLTLAAWAMAAPAGATVVAPAELSELAAEARAIVHGRVLVTSAEWTADRRAIETFVTLAVETTVKGSAAREVVFRVPGGQVGPYRSLMPGAPTFTEGDEIVVFLGAQGPAIPHVLGFNQGVYRVSVDAVRGRRVVSGAAMASGPGAERLVRGAAERQPQALEAFLERVRGLVRQGEAR